MAHTKGRSVTGTAVTSLNTTGTYGTIHQSATISSTEATISLSYASSEPHSVQSSTYAEDFSEFDALVNREVKKFRIKYLCNVSFAKCFQYQKRRVPSGKAVVVLLLICFLERMAVLSAMNGILEALLDAASSRVAHSAEKAFLKSVLVNFVSQIMVPFAGCIADVWAGRYRVISISLWLEFLGCAIIAFLSSFGSHSSLVNTCILLVAFVLINMGSAGFQANVIPFGADQILYSVSEELSSYFYWYYWVCNLGGLVYLTDYACLGFSEETNILIFSCIATMCSCMALSINYLCKGMLFIDCERRNPLRTVRQVIWYALTVKRPRVRSAFSFSREPPPRIDLAKRIHGGKFSNEQVEDVKTFLRLLCLLLAVGGALTVHAGITRVMSLQVFHLHGNLFLDQLKITYHPHLNVYSTSAGRSVNVITILIAIPALNYLVFPCLREYTPSMLKRIGIGYLFAILAPLLLAVIETVAHHQDGNSSRLVNMCMFLNSSAGDELRLSAWVVLVPYMAISFTEIFIFVSSLEFFYAQSPHNMRGLMIGLLYLVHGLSSIIAAAVLVPFRSNNLMGQLNVVHSGQSCGFWYYLIFLVVAIVTFAVYVAVSMWYKNRQRGELEESEPFYRQTPRIN